MTPRSTSHLHPLIVSSLFSSFVCIEGLKLCTFITPPKTLLAVSGGKTVLRVKVGGSIFEGCPLLSRDVRELYNAHDTAVKLPTVIKAGAVASEAAERLWPIAKLPEPGELEPCDQLHPNCCDALGYFMQLNQKIVTTAAFVQPDAITCFSQPSSSTIITASAFKGCVNLLMVTFSENLKIIGDKAFAECKSLRALYFPGSLREIGDSAFEGCLNLSSLHCQPSKKKAMQYFGVNVFKGCDALPPAAKHGWEDGHVDEDHLRMDHDRHLHLDAHCSPLLPQTPVQLTTGHWAGART